MAIITIKIKLIPTGETKEIRNNKVSYIKDITNILSIIGNEIIRLHVGNQYELDLPTQGKNISKSETIKIVETKLGTSIRNSEHQLTTKYPQIPSDIRTAFNSVIYKTICNNFHIFVV